MSHHKILQANGSELLFEEVSPQKNKIGTIVFTHGLSENGYHDKMTYQLVSALLSIGYQVILPRYNRLCDYEISPTVGDDFLQSFQALLQHGFSTHNTISIFAVSFSGPYVLKAASDPRIAHSISAILLLGPPFSYKSIIANQFSDTHKPNLFVRLILTINLQTCELSEAVKLAAKRIIVQLSTVNSLENVDRNTFDLNHEETLLLNNFLDNLENGNVKQIFSEQKINDFDRDLSLSNSLKYLQASVAIIQGADDHVIPVSEGKALYQLLINNHIKACLTITPLISHVRHKLSFHYLMKGNEMLNTFCFYFKAINRRAKNNE
jgi:pimeloyl-ACP methyl ester carboxylesterase